MHQHLQGVFKYDILPTLIKSIPWQRVKWSTNRYLPRLVCSMSIDQLVITIPEMFNIITHIQDKILKGKVVQSVWMNYYQDGADYTPYHADKYDCVVLSLSYGSDRVFKIKHNNTGKEESFTLSSGDLFIFDEVFNQQYQHSIPKTTKKVGPRVSIVFFCK